jgi:DNA-binding winged helix-turn-helix (wHTH) protein/Tol biopolymer transport system component
MGSAASPADRIFRFGQFELSEGEGELRKNGVRIKLQEQPFQVLVELLANSGKVVTREHLQQKLWPADTFVDFDVGLNTAIRKIRQALGDDADHPHYIETAAKRGYRFLAPVNKTTSAPGLVSENAAPPEPVSDPVGTQPETVGSECAPASEKYRRWYLILTALAVVALAAGALWRARWGVPHPVVEKRITANSTEAPIRAAVVSPDGKYVAYADPTGVYLRQIDGGETRPLPLPKDFNASPSSWFPDSTHLLVTSRARSEQKASVWKVSILGGTPQMLVDDAEDGSVSPDGSQIAFFRRTVVAAVGQGGNSTPGGQESGWEWNWRVSSNTVRELWLTASNGENPHKFVGPTELIESGSLGAEISAVSWAPGGRRIAYIERHSIPAVSPIGDTYSLQTRNSNGGESQMILSDHRIAPPDLCWASDGRLLYALRTDPNNARIGYGVWAIRVDQSTGKAKGNPEPVSDGLGWIGGLSVTEDGKRLVLWRGNTQSQAFVSEFDKATHRLTTPRRLTMDENTNQPTAWMPDSTSVLFLSDRNGAWKLFKQEIDQPTAEILVEARNVQTVLPRLSADGSQILFVDVPRPDDPSVPIRLMSMPLSGGVPRLVLQDRGIASFLCARTPSTICVFSKVLGTTSSFITFDTERGKGREIARFDGWPNWGLSPDGSQLTAVTDDHQGRLQFISLETGATRDVVVKEWPVLRGVDWTADGRSVLIGSVTPRGTSVILDVDMEGKARVLLEGDPHTQFVYVIPSPDGRYAALLVFTGENNVWMVENF